MRRPQLEKAIAKAQELGMIEGIDYFPIVDACRTEGADGTLTCIGFRPMIFAKPEPQILTLVPFMIGIGNLRQKQSARKHGLINVVYMVIMIILQIWDMKFTIRQVNIIALQEFDKPWLTERDTILLPIKYY